MAKDRLNDDVMMRYLLRELSDEEQVRLEELYFADDEAFEQLAALEDELIDTYVRAQMSEQRRKPFELHFLNSPERRRKLAFAESFTRYLSEVPGTASAEERETWGNRIAGWLGIHGNTARWAFAAAGAVVLIVGAGLVRENWRLRTQLRQIQAEQTELRQREEQLNKQLAQSSLPAGQRAQGKASEQEGGLHSLPVVAFALAPGVLRGGAEQKMLIIPAGPHLVELQLALENSQTYESYLAILETAEGTRAWSKAGLKTASKDGTQMVLLELSSNLLDSKDYILKLRGKRNNAPIEDIAGYSFRVLKR